MSQAAENEAIRVCAIGADRLHRTAWHPNGPVMMNVVPFRAPDKKAYDLRYQQDVVRRLSREWRPYLSPSELSVLLLIIDQTVGMSRAEWGFSYRMLGCGDKLTAGTGLDKRQLIRIVAALEEIGFIAVRRTPKGLQIEPNCEWKPGPATPREAEKRAIGRGKGKSGDTDVTSSGDTEVTPPGDTDVTHKRRCKREGRNKERSRTYRRRWRRPARVFDFIHLGPSPDAAAPSRPIYAGKRKPLPRYAGPLPDGRMGRG